MKYTQETRRMLGVRTEADLAADRALAPVVRSVQPGRYRLLRVVCPGQHRLVDVFATAEGPVCLGLGGITWSCGDIVSHEQRIATVQAALSVLTAARDQHLATDLYTVTVTCRCRTTTIPMTWLEDRLHIRSRRAVWAT